MGVPPTGFDDRVRPLGPRDQQDAVVVHVVGAVARADHRADATGRRVAEQVAHGVDRVHAHIGQRPTARERLLREPPRGAPAGMHPVSPRLDDLAQLTGHDARAHGLDVRVEPPAVRHHQRRAAAGRRLDHRVAFGHRGRHRLLDQDMLPGLEQRDRLGRVQRVGRGHDRRIDLGIAGQGLPVGRDARDVVALGEGAGRLLPVVGHGHDLMPAGAHPARVEVLDPSAAEQRHPHQRTSPVAITSRSLSRRAPGCPEGRGRGAAGGSPYSFDPVSVTPSTNTRCARKNSTITGIMNITDAAMIRLYSTWCCPRNASNPIASVNR